MPSIRRVSSSFCHVKIPPISGRKRAIPELLHMSEVVTQHGDVQRSKGRFNREERVA